ncbi:Autophagy-related protein 9 [Trinorchestia longiramus]|nr:Autophagy-related protein 9 [Trinorchestia longiramus]
MENSQYDKHYMHFEDPPMYEDFNRQRSSPHVGFSGDGGLGSSEETRTSSDNVLMHRVPERVRDWHHVDDLDSFFRRVYRFHQGCGYRVMLTRELLDLAQYLFMVWITVMVLCGVDYGLLFGNEMVAMNNNHTGEVIRISLWDGFYSFSETMSHVTWSVGIILFAALIFLLGRIAYATHNAYHYRDTKEFFSNALKIQDHQLQNVTWDEVKKQLMEVQLQQRMCVHKDILTSLDIYQRILRHQNYMVALVNQGLIPVRFTAPFVGELVFFTKGYEFNINLLLFWGPRSLLQSISPEALRQPHKKKEIIATLEKNILYLSILNFFCMFFIFVYQVLCSLYQNAERMKNEPGSLAGRCWSHYGRIYLRHYNELDHELHARLNRAYKPSMAYLNSFSSPMLSSVASALYFMAAACVAIFITLSAIDSDFLRVEHVIEVIAILVLICSACKSFIPDENLVWVPDLLMERIVAQIHYLPDAWTGKFHTTQVRDEFSKLFQYKFVHILEELFSPLFVPFILCFSLRSRAKEIVDFFHMFTVSVEGIGDVCSFAQMDIKQHGSPTWQPDAATTNEGDDHKDEKLYAPDKGRTELSLMHFALTNPDWQPPKAGAAFLTALKLRPRSDAASLAAVAEGDLAHSINSLNLTGHAPWEGPMLGRRNLEGPSDLAYVVRGVNGSVTRLEGPLHSSVHSGSQSLQGSLLHPSSLGMPVSVHPALDDGDQNAGGLWQPPIQTAYDMGMSCLYLRGLNNRRRYGHQYHDDHRSFTNQSARNENNEGTHLLRSQASTSFDPRSRMYQRTPSPPAIDPFRDAMVSHMDSSQQPPTDSISSQYQEMLYGASNMIQQQTRAQASVTQAMPHQHALSRHQQPGPSSASGASDDTPLLHPTFR